MADRVFPTVDEGALTGIASHTSLISSSNAESEPLIPPDSPGSCVSSRLQEDYDELLKYAIVVPTYNPTNTLRATLPEVKSTVASAPPLSASAAISTGSGVMHQPSFAADTTSSATAQKPTGMKNGRHTMKAQTLADEESFGEDESEQRYHGNGRPNVPSSAYHWLNLDDPVQDENLRRPSGARTTASAAAAMGDSSDDVDVGSTYSYTMTVDQDLSQMEALMDDWTMELKRKVMAEFSQTKIRILEHHRHQMMKQKDVYSGDMRRQVDETESVKELLNTYEQSIERKDQVIANLTASLQSHRDKMEIQKSFSEWKIKHNDVKREGFASNLAYRHYHRTLQRKVWDAWHSLVEARWRQRVEKACQAKAQEVCIALTNDYETKLSSLNEALESARAEVQRLQRERNLYEETMKKAFMRGVCALNLEAMTMFHEGDKDPKRRQQNDNDDHVDRDDLLPVGSSTTTPQEFVYCSDGAATTSGPAPRVIHSMTSASSHPSSSAHAKQREVDSSRGSRGSVPGVGFNAKVISAKVTARPVEVTRVASVMSTGSGFGGVAPPMSSIIVERHQPINKQTIGQATANKFQRTGAAQPPSAALQRRTVGGQGTGFPTPTPNIHTVKVVE